MSHIEHQNEFKIPLQTITDCTQNFNQTNFIGKGGYGNVYKGILKNKQVAVKRLDKTGFQGTKEFYTEITMLSRYTHNNIIAFVGFCDEFKEMIVVYEYASRGSLDKYLTNAKMLDQLTWKRRLKICIGVASALDHLHNHVAGEHRVIHRDMKSANILLDEKWKPKLSDFGLSRIGLRDPQNTYVITSVAGTHGYCDPQYEMTGILTKESDVYSLGVVLFEVLCGRLVCVVEYHDKRRFLHHLVRTHYKNGELETIVDYRIIEDIRGTKMGDFSKIAYQCLQETREKRPPIQEVVLQLKKLKDTRVEKEVVSSSSGAEVDVGRHDDVAVTAAAGGGGGGAVIDGGTGYSGSDARPKPTLNTLQPDKLDSPSSQFRLEKSKTERPKRSNMLSENTPRIFEAKQKLQLLNRMAIVRHDGAVEFEIPGDAELNALGGGCGEIYDVCNEDKLDSSEPRYFRQLQVVILIVGTRGDVQPFIAIGKRLQEYGHRVRLATHANFKDFVLTAGLEFYPLGGDPKVLVKYMIKNKGFLPSGPSEIPVQRSQMKDIIFSLLAACKEPDLDTGIPFKADAMMANPPAYGHTHVAESLKIPIHIFSTMPWTPTSEFPHPLSRVKSPAGYRLSYQIVDSSIWLGIRDIINDVRKKQLKLRPVTYLSGSQGSETDIPHGYIWSHHLVPKPKDWGPKIDVVGFCFLDLASNYEPPEDLMRWLKAGPKPIYIGFGSLPVQEPEKMTQTIVKALEMTGQRGIINIGRGGIGILTEPKDFIYSLDNVPHDWLFLQCASVVHHGGAGTTAAGLKAACPTTIVPFFGDQPFWGDRVYGRGVGPPPIPVDQFTLNKLVSAINFMLDPKVKERAIELAKAMENEDGVEGAVRAFLKHLPIHKTQ